MAVVVVALRAVAFGGGVQSVSLLVLAAQKHVDFSTFLFANVGADSEDPRTLDYLREHAGPFAERHGLALHELHRIRRDGATETLWQRLMRPGSRSLPIPVRMSNGAPGTRSCTADFKIRVLGKWLKANGASADDPATVAVGISLDEIHRAGNRRVEPYENVVYPLLDLRLRRADCATIIRDAGLPVPPKSACYFCPFHTQTAWMSLRVERPDLFDKATHLENTLNQRRAELGKDPVYLTRHNRPLAKVIPEGMQYLPLAVVGDQIDDEGGCQSGHCWT